MISIHALCEEGDPCERFTARCTERISIHALCEEGDAWSMTSSTSTSNFYPRPLRGGRPTSTSKRPREKLFLSTPSARRATLLLRCPVGLGLISIHALCEEGDLEEVRASLEGLKFLSTPSARRATLQARPRYRAHRRFLSTPSARRATNIKAEGSGHLLISIHALCEEGDPSAPFCR